MGVEMSQLCYNNFDNIREIIDFGSVTSYKCPSCSEVND